jgi:hypothetical protein
MVGIDVIQVERVVLNMLADILLFEGQRLVKHSLNVDKRTRFAPSANHVRPLREYRSRVGGRVR